MQWNLLITGCSVLLIILLMIKEYRRPNRRLLGLRLLASVLAVCSLAGMALPLSFKTTKPAGAGGPLIVLTEGATPDSVEKFLANRNLRIYTTDTGLLKRFRHLRPELVPGTDHLAARHPGRAWEIFGYGLDAYELKALSGTSYRFHPPQDPDGITSVYWPAQLDAGTALTVQGFYRNGGPRPVKLVLRAFGNSLDSAMIAAGGSAFELTAMPKPMGKAVFSLVSISGTDTISADPVPVTIETPEPLRVLMLSEAPDFEYRFLKDWLAENGYGVTVRTRITGDKFDVRFTGPGPSEMERITPAALAGYDLVLAGHRELAALRRDELGALESAVERGMGLVVRTDTAMEKTFYARHFPVRPVSRPEQAPLFRLAGERKTEFRLDDPAVLQIRPAGGTRPHLTDTKNHIVVSSRLFGRGYVLVSALQPTYPLVLQGRTAAYGALWSSILSSAAARKTEPLQRISPLLPRSGEPAELETSASPERLPRISVSGTLLVPEQSMNLYDRWKTVYWPEEPGWVPIQTEGAPPASFYVYPDNAWRTVRLTGRLNETRRHASPETGGPVHREEVRMSEQPVPKTWLFAIFLISCGFLWHATKILSAGIYAGRKNM